MATTVHPLTGVELNDIAIHRKRLDEAEAVTAHLLRQSGTKYADIAHMLGTNPARVGEVLRGDAHPKAAYAALDLLR